MHFWLILIAIDNYWRINLSIIEANYILRVKLKLSEQFIEEFPSVHFSVGSEQVGCSLNSSLFRERFSELFSCSVTCAVNSSIAHWTVHWALYVLAMIRNMYSNVSLTVHSLTIRYVKFFLFFFFLISLRIHSLTIRSFSIFFLIS